MPQREATFIALVGSLTFVAALPQITLSRSSAFLSTQLTLNWSGFTYQPGDWIGFSCLGSSAYDYGTWFYVQSVCLTYAAGYGDHNLTVSDSMNCTNVLARYYCCGGSTILAESSVLVWLSFSQTPTVSISCTMTPTQGDSLTASPRPSITPTKSSTHSSTQGRSSSQSLTRSQSSTPSQSPSLSLTTTQSITQTPSSSRTPSLSLSMTATPSNSPTSSITMTSTITQIATPSNSPTSSITMTSTITQSATQLFTMTSSLPPSPSLTTSSSQSLTATQMSSASATQVPTLSPSPSLSQASTASSSSSQASTASASSLPFALSLIPSSSQICSGVAGDGRLVLSDSCSVAAVNVSISRCPDVTQRVHMRLSCVSYLDASYPTAMTVFASPRFRSSGTSSASEIECDPDTNAGVVPIALVVYVGDIFGTRGGVGTLVCDLTTSGATIGRGFLPLRVIPTRWPLVQDIIIAAVGTVIMRSSLLQLTVNVSESLALACGASCDTMNAATNPERLLGAARDTFSINSISVGSSPRYFSVTLAGASWLVLRAPLGTFSARTRVTLGGKNCSILAIVTAGDWALVGTPSSSTLCGETAASDGCGYFSFQLSNPPDILESSILSSVSLSTAFGSKNSTIRGASLLCPPFCPRELDQVLPFAADSSLEPPLVPALMPRDVEALPAVVEVPSITSEGFYIASSCSKSGLFPDPASGACINVSSPTSFLCAYGGGDGCSTCPSSALCPGGYRTWPRTGFWTAGESRGLPVLKCPPPASRCVGWNITFGVAQCGPEYSTGSFLCSVCAQGYFVANDGSCARCPRINSFWERHAGVLWVGIAVFCTCLLVYAAVFTVSRFVGGTVAGGASRALSFGHWSWTTAQVFSDVSAVLSPSIPVSVRTLYSAVAVLQFDGVAQPPACTGSYIFEQEVTIMVSSLFLWLTSVAMFYFAPRSLNVIGRLLLACTLACFPAAVLQAGKLLNCESITLSAAGAAALDGGASTLGAARVVVTSVLVDNPFIVCWAPGGSHLTVGYLAIAVMVLYALGFPLLSFIWLVQAFKTSATGSTRRRPCSLMAASSNRAKKLRVLSSNDSFHGTPQGEGHGRYRCCCLARERSPQVSQPNVEPEARFNGFTYETAGALRSRLRIAGRFLHLKPDQTAPGVLGNDRDRDRAGAASVGMSMLRGPDPTGMLGVFQNGVRPRTWYLRHADLALLTVLSLYRAFQLRPKTLGAILAKACVICVALLSSLTHLLITQPFTSSDSWKMWVRSFLLVDSVGSTVLNAGASAIDAGLTSDALVFAVSLGSYLLLAMCAATSLVLIVSFMSQLIREARAEQAAMTDRLKTANALGLLSMRRSASSRRAASTFVADASALSASVASRSEPFRAKTVNPVSSLTRSIRRLDYDETTESASPLTALVARRTVTGRSSLVSPGGGLSRAASSRRRIGATLPQAALGSQQSSSVASSN